MTPEQEAAARRLAGHDKRVSWVRLLAASLDEIDRLRGLIDAAGAVISEVGCDCACHEAEEALDRALADAAAAAEAYRAEARAEGIEAAAAFVARNYTGDDMPPGSEIADDLRTFAAGERGGR